MATPKKQAAVGTAGKVGIGASITAAAVAAAGAYFLYGSKDAKKNRQKVAGWAEDAKKEVLKGIEKAKTMTEDEYKELIEKVATAQAQLKKVSQTDLKAFQKEMKDGWKVIAKNVVSGVAAAKRAMPAEKKPAAKAVAKKLAKPAAAKKPAVEKKPAAPKAKGTTAKTAAAPKKAPAKK